MSGEWSITVVSQTHPRSSYSRQSNFRLYVFWPCELFFFLNINYFKLLDCAAAVSSCSPNRVHSHHGHRGTWLLRSWRFFWRHCSKLTKTFLACAKLNLLTVCAFVGGRGNLHRLLPATAARSNAQNAQMLLRKAIMQGTMIVRLRYASSADLDSFSQDWVFWRHRHVTLSLNRWAKYPTTGSHSSTCKRKARTI